MAQRLRKVPHDVVRQDRKLIGRHGDATEIVVAEADGSFVHDARGRTYVDFQMGWCVGNLGWNNPEIVGRMREHDGPAYVHPGMIYPPALELAKQLTRLAPNGLTRVYRAVGGSEAVELAMQLAVMFTGRTKFVSIDGAYHGNSFGARSLGEPLEAKLGGCKKLPLPLDLDRLETLLRRRDVAAFVMEPIAMNLGVLVPEPEFMDGANELCERYGTLFVADEVACGFGRTGKLFASEHFDLHPDILCLGKAMTSGCAPIAATLCTGEIADAVREDFSFYSTYGWHPLGIEAALATLDIFEREREQLFDHVEDLANYFLTRLLQMPWDDDTEIHMKGLAISVDCADPEYVEQLARRCREDGLLLADEDEHVMMFPALTIDRETARRGLDILEQAI